jgi:hypothetical protein
MAGYAAALLKAGSEPSRTLYPWREFLGVPRGDAKSFLRASGLNTAIVVNPRIYDLPIQAIGHYQMRITLALARGLSAWPSTTGRRCTCGS